MQIVAAGKLGQAGFDNPPAAVCEVAVEGGLADDVAGDANRRGVEAFRQRDRGCLPLPRAPGRC
jgi:hypothetical protein